jgi:hypothetical protein
MRVATQQLYKGDVLALEAFWQARRTPGNEYLARLLLVDAAGATVVEKTFSIATPAHSTLTWQKGEIVRGQYSLEMPRDIAAGQYSMRFELDDVAHDAIVPLRPCGLRALIPGASGALQVVVEERPRSFDVPAMAYPVSAAFGGAITLLGYDVEPQQSTHRLAPGDALTITVHLQAQTTMDADYAIFLHLVDETGHIWGQQDKPAGGAAHPTTRWLAKEVVSTTLSAVVQPQVQTGRLTGIMGIYNPTTTNRLPVSSANPPADYISLFGLDIVR